MPSPPSHRIVIYASVEPAHTPETAKYAAGLLIGYDTNPRWTCTGATAAEAREKMEKFWETERKSHEPREAPKKGKPAPGMDAPEPVSEVAEDDEVL